MQTQHVGDGGDAEVPDGGRARAEQGRGQIGHHLIDQSSGQERSGESGPALQPHLPDVPIGQDLQRPGRVALTQLDGRGGSVEHPGRGGENATTHHHAQRLTLVQRPVRPSHRQRRIVGEHGPGTHHDRPRLGPEAVHIRSSRRSGDPLTRAVGGSRSSVQGRGELPHHTRTAAGDGERPGPVELARLLGQHATLHGHTARAQPGRATRRLRIGISLTEHHPLHPGIQQRPRARAATPLMVTRLQRDPRSTAVRLLSRRRQRLHLGMRVTRAAMEPLPHHSPVGGGHDSADAGIGIRNRPQRGKLQGTTHQRLLVRHPFPSRSTLPASPGEYNDRSGVDPTLESERRPGQAIDESDTTPPPAGHAAALRTCYLPSGLSPSVLEFHQINRPLAAAGSRTITAGSELHRPRSTSLQYARIGAGGRDCLERMLGPPMHADNRRAE